MSHELALGTIHHPTTTRKTDFLYRVSIRGVIRDTQGRVLIVKEAGKTWWTLPGGGIDHQEDIKTAIAREMQEEVNLKGDFSYHILAVEEPAYLERLDLWQIRLIFEIKPANFTFSPGEDGDEIAFIDPASLKDSESETERKIYYYANL